MRNIRKQIEEVRRFTGDAFTSKNGYDLRKPLNFGRRMAVLKYYRKIEELISGPYQEYRPRTKQEKRSAFEYTGQNGYNKFSKAIISKISPSHDYTFSVDKSRPRGSQFVVTDKVSGQRYYHISAQVLLNAEEEAHENGENPNEYIEAVIEQYAEDANFFLIQAGESYMWGSAGGAEQVADKISLILQNYGASMFQANDKRSSYYGNWFRGVTAFTRRQDAYPLIAAGLRKKRERMEQYHLGESKFRRLKDGSIGEFRNGALLRRFFIE